MRLCTADRRPSAVKLPGMPTMPKRKKISTAIIKTVLRRRFLFMRDCNP
jgi:hypothetical protein